MNFEMFSRYARQIGVLILFLVAGIFLLLSPRAIKSCKKPREVVQLSASGAEFPITIHDAAGREVIIEARPLRIVALSPSITEIIYALHAEDRLVGNSRYCMFPVAARAIPKIGGIVDPSLEALKGAKPDLVLCTSITPTRIIQAMESTGITVVVFNHQRITELQRDVDLIGKVIGSQKEADVFLSNLQKRLDVIQARAAGMKGHPTAVILYGLDTMPIAGVNSFSGEVLKLVGGVNLGERTGLQWTQLSMEQLIQWNPDVIFIDSYESYENSVSLRKQVDSLSQDARWKTLSAIRNHRVHILYDSIASIPGPRTIDLAEEFQAALMLLHE